MIDLHCHTTASDGTLPPAEIVRLAARAGVRILAITDHDTMEAIPAAWEAAKGRGLRIVAGVEISARIGETEIHVLGHFVDPSHPGLLSRLADFAALRASRAERMVEKLRSHGVDLRLEEILAEAGGDAGSIGRPHFARLLVAKGVAANFQDAFDRWLGEGMPGWVEREFPEAEEAIELIREAGGASSLAHPALSKVEGSELMALAKMGLDALEVDHPGQSESTRRKLRIIARSLGLLSTGGSDFHGESGGPGMEGMDAADFGAYEALIGDRVGTY